MIQRSFIEAGYEELALICHHKSNVILRSVKAHHSKVQRSLAQTFKNTWIQWALFAHKALLFSVSLLSTVIAALLNDLCHTLESHFEPRKPMSFKAF